MQKFTFAFIFFLFLIGISASAQQHYKIGNGIHLFYPEKFDSASHFPSFALIEELPVLSTKAEDCSIIPEFYNREGQSCANITIPEQVDLYGTGEGTGPLRRNGRTIECWNTDNYGYYKHEGKRLYQSHPWILGVNNDGTSFGILIDNTWKQELNLNNPIEIVSEGPPFRIIIIEKSTPQEVVKTLAELTGKIELPPLWTLGYQQSRYSYYPDSAVKALADSFRIKQIPCDVIWLDIDYMQGFRIFTFDSLKFPDPKGLNTYLHINDFKTVWMIDPGVKKDEGYFVYDQGTANNYWTLTDSGKTFVGKVWPGDCVFPDYTMQETRQWWSGLYKDYMAKGIDGVWNDMNEPSVFDGPDNTMPETNYHRGDEIYPSGPHLRYHNVYGYLMVKASKEGILAANPNERPFILSRANFIGGQRYAATWTGDNISSADHMKLSIPMSLNLSLSGQPFNGPDIGGFVGDANEELLAEWMAVGAFYPFCRNHDDGGEIFQDPWSFGSETEKVSKVAMERRYRLLPYLYTLFHEAATTGMPIMQPVFFDDIADTSLRAEEDAFMLGKNLLIVPKWSKNPSLPKGKWELIDLVGEKSSSSKYHPDLLIKGGSIIPAGQVVQHTEGYKTDTITLFVCLDSLGKAFGNLYADNGNDFSYKKGNYLSTEFKASTTPENKVIITCSHTGNYAIKRVYKIVLVSSGDIMYSGWMKGNDLSISLK